MKFISPHLFSKIAKSKGLPNESISKAIAYSNKLYSQQLPVIYSLKHLSLLTRIDYGYLRRIIKRNEDPYSIFQMKKRRGGIRNICIPTPKIAQVQKFISKSILSKVLPNSSSYAYHPGSKIVDCCQQHCGSQWLIKVDIQQFFENISELMVFKIFNDLGYTRLLSLEFARLCTRKVERSVNSDYWKVWKRDNYLVIPHYSSRFLGSLPQGASTSPFISNLVCKKMDIQFNNVMGQKGIVYTRYADDLTFSSSTEIKNREDAKKIVSEIYGILFSFGFRPKTAKTKIIPPGAKKIVLGLNVEGSEPRLTKEFKYKVEKHLHCIEKYGLLEYSTYLKFRNPISFRNHLSGLINYALMVEAGTAGKWKEQLNLISVIGK
ncbi:reverse transcriptase family protein [Leptospira wolffii]|uniref:RNA-directed DNA polymerase n=1 Tax=Leptospira wolffii TaxID=409998 RepID=A0ABV5BTX9_9LEPT